MIEVHVTHTMVQIYRFEGAGEAAVREAVAGDSDTFSVERAVDDAIGDSYPADHDDFDDYATEAIMDKDAGEFVELWVNPS